MRSSVMAQHGHCSNHTHSLYMILSTHGSHCHPAWGATRIPRHNAYSNTNASDRWGVTLSRFENLQGTGCRSTGGTAQAAQCVRCPLKISIALLWRTAEYPISVDGSIIHARICRSFGSSPTQATPHQTSLRLRSASPGVHDPNRGLRTFPTNKG